MEVKMKKDINGITLIALVITIIVMLILVAVTISMAINGGLFKYAGNATKDTETEKQKEMELAEGRASITLDGHTFNSMDELNQYLQDGTVPVTFDDILGFIEDDDVYWNSGERGFTEKLGYLGFYSGSYGGINWREANVFRCSIDDKIYIVGKKDENEEVEVERLEWDGTTILGNDGYPITLSTQFGTYQRGDSLHEGEFTLNVGYNMNYDSVISEYIIPRIYKKI